MSSRPGRPLLKLSSSRCSRHSVTVIYANQVACAALVIGDWGGGRKSRRRPRGVGSMTVTVPTVAYILVMLQRRMCANRIVTLRVRVFAQPIECTVGHLRTRGARHEVDLIVERPDQRILAIEVKLSPTIRHEDVVHLKWLKNELGDDLVERDCSCSRGTPGALRGRPWRATAGTSRRREPLPPEADRPARLDALWRCVPVSPRAIPMGSVCVN